MTPTNPDYKPSGYYYIFPQTGIKTDIPEEHLCSFQDALTVMQEMSNLYSQQCGLQSLTPVGATFVNNGGLVYLGITVPGQAGTIYAGLLVNEKKAGKGTWHLTAGGPVWVLDTITLPSPVPVNNGTGSFMPGAAITATDVLNYLIRKFGQ